MAARFSLPLSWRLVWLSLAVVAVVAAWNRSLPPLVQTLGFAHARLVETRWQSSFLVVDHLSPAAASALRQLYPLPVCGRHGYRVHEILLPMLALAAALTILSHSFSQALQRLGRPCLQWLPAFREAFPPTAMLGGLLVGAGLGWALRDGHLFLTELALMPFVLSIMAVAVLLLPTAPQARRVQCALLGMSASRWFWLGFLVFSWPRPEWAGAAWRGHPSAPWQTALGTALAFLALHFATRAPRQRNLGALRGDTRLLVRTCDRLTLLSIRELWVVLPLWILAAVQLPHWRQLEHLQPYLLNSVVAALLMKWVLQGPISPTARGLERLGGSLVRVTTLATIFCLPAIVFSQLYFGLVWGPAALPFVVIALGLVRGRPWHSGRPCHDLADGLLSPISASSTPVRPARHHWTPRTALAAVAAGLALLVGIGSSLRWDRQPALIAGGEPGLVQLRLELGQSFGHRLRLLKQGPQSLLLGFELSAQERAEALSLSRQWLPADQLQLVEVKAWRWEWAGQALLWLGWTVSALAGLGLRLGTLTTPGRLPLWTFAMLAGVNGAFALGAAWGWFWLNPVPPALAFAFCTAVAGLPGSPARALSRTAATSEPVMQEGPAYGATGGDLPPAELPPGLDFITVQLPEGLLGGFHSPRGWRLRELVAGLRARLAKELGLLLPPVRLRESLELEPDRYLLRVREVEVDGGRALEACPTTDPVDAIVSHLEEVIRDHADQLITVEYVARELERARRLWPRTVGLVEEKHSLVTLRDVYRGLVSRGLSLRDQELLLNILLGESGSSNRLIACCQQALQPSGPR